MKRPKIKMKIDEVFCNTFKALRHELGHDRPRDLRPMWQQRLSVDSDFCKALVANSYLTEKQMRHAAERYRLGISRDGGVIYWQIDQTEQVYDGKIMYYRPDCHRDHDRHPQWVSNLLKRHYLKNDKELIATIPSYHCLFGTHLINLQSDNLQCTISNASEQKSIAIVEAEKTAVILSEHYPDCLWLATGGLYELTPAKLFPLRGRRIILFPDTDVDGKAYGTWYKVMLEAQRLLGHPIHLSPLLEQRATREQKERKIDLVDFIFRG